MSSYRPLPDCLTIKESEIEGLGLFATKFIKKNTMLGKSHFLNGVILERTAVGSFYNHSENPNSVKVTSEGSTVWHLHTTRDIEAGEEITVKYTFYSIT